MLRSLIALIVVLAALLAPAVVQAACGLIPADYPIFGGNEVDINSNPDMNGTQISSGSTYGDQVVAIDATRSTQALAFPNLEPATFPTNSSSLDQNENDSPFTSSTDVYYDKITINNNNSATFSGGGPFHINELEIHRNATANLEAGIYYIGILDMHRSNATLNVVSDTVIIHIGNTVDAHAQRASINSGGSVTGLQIFMHSGTSGMHGENSDFTGIIYGFTNAKYEIKQDSTFHGVLLVEDEAEVDGNVDWTYTTADKALVAAVSTCQAGPADHFDIAHDGTAEDCVPESITIRAEDSGGNTVAGYTGAVTLNTSTANGDWQKGSGGALGTLTAGASDSGNATYTFVAGDNGVVVLDLANTNQETLSINLNASGVTESGGLDPSLTVGACATILMSCSTWDDSSWTYRKPIIIDASKVPSDQTGFPVLVSTVDSHLAANAQSDGDDIYFTDSDGTTKLDHEIEYWSSSTGELVAWVEVPTLTSSSNDVLYMYYGNGTAVDQSNAAGVWDSNYSGVWHLSESGTGNRADSTSNNNHATTSGYEGDEATSSGMIAGADHFDGTDDYLETTNNIGITGGSARTITYWAYLDNTIDRQPMVIWGVDGNNNRFGTDGRGSNWYLWGWSSSADWDTGVTVSTGSWVHHAVRNDGTLSRWFVNGTELGTGSTHTYNTTDSHARFGYQLDISNSSYYDGLIDEVRISDISRSPDWFTTEYNNQLNPSTFHTIGNAVTACGADHYAISHDGTGINCQAETVTITAHDTSHSAFTDTSTITLSTSTSHGDWTKITGAGTLVNSGSGAGTYTFDSSDAGVVVLGLRDTYAETTNINITNGTNSESASEDSNLVYAAAGFNFLADSTKSAIGTQIGGKASNIAPGSQTLELQAVRTSDDTGQCESFLTGSNTIQLAFECENPTTCTTNDVTINGTAIQDNGNGASLTYTDVSLDFGTTSDTTATLVFSYPDVGQLQLHSKLTLSPSGENLLGSSNSFVSRPFGLRIAATGNTGTTTAAGTIYRSAGSDFPVSVGAVLWQSADDSNSDGIPDGHNDTTATNNATLSDNTAALNFGQETTAEGVAVSATLLAPSSGNNPGLGGGTTISSFTSGVGSNSNIYWDEVGLIEITGTPADGNYLGIGTTETAKIVGASGYVGRFTPYDFAMSYNTPQFATTCNAGGFSYLGASFGYTTDPVLTVTAQSLHSTTTQNYTGSWFKLTGGALTGLSYAAGSGTLLGGNPNTPTIADAGSGVGTLTFDNGPSLSFQRGSPITPFNAEISLSLNVIDSDSVAFSSNPARFSNTTTGMAFDAGKEMRFGILILENSHESELVAQQVPFQSQYFNGSYFLSNTSDSCTTVSTANLSQTPSPGTLSSTPSIANSPLLSGNAGLQMSAPGVGVTGYTDLVFDLSVTGADMSWLAIDSDGDGTYAENPGSRVTFGVYRGSDSIIYVREIY
ncbi:MAG: DUF2341 domain-containing protein [bacterium]|nr:DUF2341 domain-containing protein [bacterium]